MAEIALEEESYITDIEVHDKLHNSSGREKAEVGILERDETDNSDLEDLRYIYNTRNSVCPKDF